MTKSPMGKYILDLYDEAKKMYVLRNGDLKFNFNETY